MREREVESKTEFTKSEFISDLGVPCPSGWKQLCTMKNEVVFHKNSFLKESDIVSY